MDPMKTTHIVANSIFFKNIEVINSIVNPTKDKVPTKPSTPSIKLKALTTPVPVSPVIETLIVLFMALLILCRLIL